MIQDRSGCHHGSWTRESKPLSFPVFFETVFNELRSFKCLFMISIIKGEPYHASLLSQLGSLSIVESHGHSAPAHVMQSYVDKKLTEAVLREELEDGGNIYYIIYYNGQPAGYSKIIYNIPIEPVAETNITKMERLYLLRTFYDLKLGHQLMEFNIDLAKNARQAGMWLYVWKENHRAIRFYERAGFGIVGDGYFRLSEDHANPNWQMYLPFAQ
jgi:ribosomal protein S18 acetylase RimI-like enzyme